MFNLLHKESSVRLNFVYIMDMKKQNKILDTVLKQITFFCLYWGFYAIGWHYCTQIKMGHMASFFYEAAIYVSIASVTVYVLAAIFFHTWTTLQSSEPSDKC